MGDILKLSKDKRHRSSSSLVGPVLEGTRSERRLDIRGSILEVDDQFALAEARCDELQEKIDLVKGLKRKKKLRKRSTTRVVEQQPVEEHPYISVHTQPKKTAWHAPGQVQAAARARRLQAPNPARGYVDPATEEQHRMLGHVRHSRVQRPTAHDDYKVQDKHVPTNPIKIVRSRMRQSRADGDIGRGTRMAAAEVACGDDGAIDTSSNHYMHDSHRADELYELGAIRSSAVKNASNVEMQKQNKPPAYRRRHVPRDIPLKEGNPEVPLAPWRTGMAPTRRLHSKHTASVVCQPVEERPVVELFHKNRSMHSVDLTRCNSHDQDNSIDDCVFEPATKDKEWRHRKRVKYRSRGYELPTLASQMKQNNIRSFCQTTNYTAIPFITSKSTAPSHNIGVNIQQVLNGLKNQQPLSCIPLTIAHHMGLGHIPPYETKNLTPSLDYREINAIRLGRRLLRLPSYKYVSYNRLLNLYRESEGMVSRFLRSIDRPNQFYTSMYNLATRDDGAGTVTSRSRAINQEAKQSLAEYASLYQEYQQVDRQLKERYDQELDARKEDLVRKLAEREEHIRKVVQDYRSTADNDGLRASASTAEDTYRLSSIKLHGVDALQ